MKSLIFLYGSAWGWAPSFSSDLGTRLIIFCVVAAVGGTAFYYFMKAITPKDKW